MIFDDGWRIFCHQNWNDLVPLSISFYAKSRIRIKMFKMWVHIEHWRSVWKKSLFTGTYWDKIRLTLELQTCDFISNWKLKEFCAIFSPNYFVLVLYYEHLENTLSNSHLFSSWSIWAYRFTGFVDLLNLPCIFRLNIINQFNYFLSDFNLKFCSGLLKMKSFK